ncbi:MAG: P-II family nitrogen regulator [Nitrosopumilus sp.]|jgi:nitrogen regulatory protein P-II 1|nr:P-II family nitrogen regulator [Nitrosopumilus sp.]MDH3825034.1 P-II family nitrogen regulator [Nitrosopumilus sp.]
MKKIEAIIRDTKFQEVKNTLTKLGVKGMTTYEVRGRGDQIGMIRTGEGSSDYEADDLVPKRKIEIVCIEEELSKIVNSIASNATTGKPGDGKIFVSDIVDVVRIRTVEKGQDAV